ncbi:MAG: hypothetical protein U0930_17240 [Pirellulales bacterium]
MFEELEHRYLMVTDITVNGSSQSQNDMELTISGGVMSITNTDSGTQTFNVSDIGSLTIDGLGRNDSVRIKNGFTLPAGKDLSVTAEEIYVEAGVSIQAHNISLVSSGSEVGLTVASNLPVDLADLFSSDRIINIANGSSLVAGGSINIHAQRVSDVYSPFRPFGYGNKDADVVIGAATLTGAAVSIEADAKDLNIDNLVPDYASNFSNDLVQQVYGSLGVPVPVSVMIRKSESTVTLNSTTITVSGTVFIDSTAATDATTNALSGTALGSSGPLTAGFSKATTLAETKLLGTTSVTAGGSVTITSHGATRASQRSSTKISEPDSAGGSVDLKQFGGAISIAIADTTIRTQIGPSVEVESTGGNVDIKADGKVYQKAESSVSLYEDGSGGLAVAVAIEQATVETLIDGKITAAGFDDGLTLNASNFTTPTSTLYWPAHGLSTGDKLFYLASKADGTTPTTFEDLNNEQEFYVVVLDQDHFQLVEEPAIDLTLNSYGPYDPNAANSTHSLTGVGYVPFDSSTAVNLASNTIRVSSADIPNLNLLVSGMEVTYLMQTNDEAIEPVAIGGLAPAERYVVKNVTNVPGASPAAVTLQLARLISPNTIVDLSAAGVGGNHFLQFEAAAATFVPNDDDANNDNVHNDPVVDITKDEIKIPNHGWQTGDEVVYRVDPTKSSTQAMNKLEMWINAFDITLNPSGTVSSGPAVTNTTDDVFHNIDLASLPQGSRVKYIADATGTAIPGLNNNQIYYTIPFDDGTVGLASNYSNAIANSRIDLTGTGTGSNHRFVVQVIDTATDSITVPSHGLVTGQKVTYDSGQTAGTLSDGNASAGLTDGQDYFVIVIDEHNLAFSATRTDALSGTRLQLTSAYFNNDNQHFVSSTVATDFDATRSDYVVDPVNNTIQILGHGLTNGTKVLYQTGGGNPIGGLQDGQEYFVRVDSTDSTKIRLTTDSNAVNSNAVAFITLTRTATTPTGDHVFTVIPGDVEPTTDSIFLPNHDLADGDLVRYTHSGLQASLNNLSLNSTYEVFRVDGNRIQLKNSNTHQTIDLSGGPAAEAQQSLEVLDHDSPSTVVRTINFTPVRIGIAAVDVTFDPTAEPTVNTSDYDSVNNPLGDSIRLVNHPFSNGQVIRYLANGQTSSVGGITVGDQYKVVYVDADHFRLTEMDNSPVDLTSAATGGQHSFEFDRQVTVQDKPIGGLVSEQTYFVVRIDANTIRFAETLDAAHEASPVQLHAVTIDSTFHKLSKEARDVGVSIVSTLDVKDAAHGSSVFHPKGEIDKVVDRIKSVFKKTPAGAANASKLQGKQGAADLFSVSGGFSYNKASHTVNTTIGSTAEIESQGSLKIDANLKNKVSSRAFGVAQSGRPQTTRANAPQRKFSAGVAVSIGDYSNSATTVINSGAQLDASKGLDITSDVNYPFFRGDITLKNIVNTFTGDRDYKQTGKELISAIFTIKDIVNGGAVTQAVSSTGEKPAMVAVTGGLVLSDYNTVSHAIVEENVKINQKAALQAATQSLNVEAYTRNRLVETSGKIDPMSPYGSVHELLHTNAASDLGVGGSFIISTVNVDTQAIIRRGAEVRTGSNRLLQVRATENTISIIGAVQGQNSGGSGVSGSLDLIEHNATTLAQIEDGVTIVAGDIVVDATSDQYRMSIAGGYAKSKSVGAGVSVSKVSGSRTTQAVTGDNPDVANDVSPTKVTSITARSVNVNAENDGFTFALGIAGASVSNTKADDAVAAVANPTAGGNASGVGTGAITKRSGVGIAGDATWIEQSTKVNAIVDTDGSISLTGGDLNIQALDSTTTVTASGAAALTRADNSGGALSGSFSRNIINSDLSATLRDTTVLNAQSVTVNADRDTALYAFSVALGMTTLTAEMRADRNFGASIAGSFSWNTLDLSTHAEVVNSQITSGANVSVTADDGSEMLAIGGGIGIVIAGTIGLGAGVGINEINNSTTTNITNSTITAVGDVTLTTNSHNKIHGVGFSLGAGAFGISGTVGINAIDGDSTLDIAGSTINSTTGSIIATTNDSSEIRSDAGGVAIGVNIAKGPVPASSYAVAAGAAVGINAIGVNDGRTVATRVSTSSLTADDAVTVTTNNNPSITALTIAAAGSLAQSAAATAIAAGLAGAGSRNTIETTVVTSIISNSHITVTGTANGGAAGGTATVSALDESQIQVDAGGFAISVALTSAGRSALAGALGAGIAVNEINGSLQSIVDASTIQADGNATISAGTDVHSDGTSIDSLAIAGSGAVGVSSSQGAGGSLAGAAAAAFNHIKRGVLSTVRNGGAVTTTSSGDVAVTAFDSSKITSDTGGLSIAVGIAPGQGAGVGLAIGASVSVNSIGNDGALNTLGQVVASIDASTVNSAGDTLVSAEAINQIDALAIAGAGSVGGSSTAPSVSAAGAGAATYNVIRRNIQASITTASTVTSVGSLQVLAKDSSSIRASAIGASVAVGGGGSGPSFAGAIGVSIAENRIDNAVKSMLNASSATAGSITVDAKTLGIEIGTISQSGANGVTPAQMDDATQQDSDLSSTAATNEFNVDKSADDSVKDKLFRQILGIGTTAYPLGFQPELELQSLASNGVTDQNNSQHETRTGSAWLLIDKVLEKAYIVSLESGVLKAYQSSFSALAVAASVSVAAGSGNGLSLTGGGASTENIVTTKIDSQIIGGSITTLTTGGGTGDVQVSAANAAGIVSTVVAASLAVTVSGGSGGGLAIGAAIAKNSIGYDGSTRNANTVHAQLDGATVSAAGDLSITAANDARIGTTVIAASVAVSGASGTSVGLAGAGASARNLIAIDATAELKNVVSGQLSTMDLNVSAVDRAAIHSLAGAASLAVAAAGGNAGALTIGVGLAKNQIDSNTVAIINSSVIEKISTTSVVVRPASGAVPQKSSSFNYRDFAAKNITVGAISTGTIDSVAFAASMAAGIGGGNSIALAGAGAEATNQISGSTKATIENSRIANNGTVDLDSGNNSDVFSSVVSVAVAAAGGGNASLGAALGVALSRNLIGFEHNGCSSVTYSSNSPRTIVIHTNDTILLGSGPGAGDLYKYIGTASLSDPSPSDPNSDNWLSHIDFNDSSKWERIDVQAVGSGVQSGLVNSSIVSAGALTADSASTANIRATVVSASAAITGGGNLGVSAAGAGTGVYNRVVMDISSSINGDSNLVNPAASETSYKGPDGVIIYAGSDAEIVAVMPNALADSFAGTGLPKIHVQSIGLTSNDNSSISSIAGAVSIAASVTGLISGSIAVGAAVAENSVNNSVHSFIQNADDGIFTTGSSDVTTTQSTQTINGQSVTLNNYTISAERHGNIALTATETATIDSVSFAAALAASASLLAASIAGAGARSLNIINNQVQTNVKDSTVSAFGELAKAADGTVVGVTPASLVLTSTNSSNIDSEVVAVSAAVAGSFFAGAGSIGVALAENRIGDSSAASGNNTHGTYATITGSNVSTTGDVQVLATSSEQVRTVSAAGSVAIAVGVGAAGSATGTTSDATISGDTHASIVDSVVVAGGNLDVKANSTAKVTEATAIGASVAAATGALSIAVTMVENLIHNDVKAWLAGSSSHHVAALGDVTIQAKTTEASIKNVQGVTASLSAGLHSASAGGMSLVNTIDNRVFANVTGAIHVDAGGKLTVASDETSEISADAAGVTVAISLGAAVGVALVQNTISSQIKTNVATATLSGTDIDILANSAASLSKTRTVGVAASLVGVTNNIAQATLATAVEAKLVGATVAATEDLTVQAKSNNYARSAADGGAIGAFAAGVMVAEIEQGGLKDGSNDPTPEVRAELGDGSTIQASGVILEAQSTDNLLASSVSATGGIVAINGAVANVTSDQSTLARIGTGTSIVANAINVNSFANQNADSSADSLTIAAASGAGASTTNRVYGDTKIEIGSNTNLHSNVFTANAANSITKDGIGGSNNIRGGSVSGVGVTVVKSDTNIGDSSNQAGSYISVLSGANIDVAGSNAALGILQLQATMKADALDSVRLETASGYSLTTALSEVRSNTDANINISGASIINRSGDISITTQSDVGLRPSSNLFSAASQAAAGANAIADSDIDNTIAIGSGTVVRGSQVNIQSGRDNFQVPNLMSNFADIEVTTVSLGPSITIGVPQSKIDFINNISITGASSIQGYRDVNLISERNLEIPARADTDGLVLSLSGVPYGYPVSSAGEHVGRTTSVNVSADSTVTAGLYNKSVLLVRSVPIDGFDTAKLGQALSAPADFAWVATKTGVTLDQQIPYQFAPLNVSQIAIDISIDTIIHVVSGFAGNAVAGHYYKYRPLDPRGRLRNDVESTALVLQSQNYLDTQNWVDLGTSLPVGFDPDVNPPVYDSNHTAAFEQALAGKFYVIKNPDMPSPTLSYKNVGNLLVAQRNQVLSWMASHSNNTEAVARYQEQLNQIDNTLTDLGLVSQETVNGQTKTIITEDLDALFLQLPGVYAAPGSVFVEGDASQVTLAGQVKARNDSSITIQNASPFVPVVSDAIIRDNRRVAVVDQELRQFVPGNVFLNWQIQGTPAVDAGVGSSTISITHLPSSGDFQIPDVPTNVLKDLYVEGSVVNEDGSVSISNPAGTINVFGEVRGASVNINAGKDFNLNTEDWIHINRDPRQYINYFPLRQSVFNEAGTTQIRTFASASGVNIPTYRTIRFWGFTITVPVQGTSTLQDSINQNSSQVLAQGAISVTARYLNVNGLIQSGAETLTLNVAANFNPGHSTTSLTDAQNLPLPGISFGTPNDSIVDVPVSGYFDAANRSIIVNAIQPSGGRVTLVGELLSTGNGKIVAAYGHASVNINNQSNYRLVMNEVDTTANRVGEVILIDSNLETKTVFSHSASGTTKTHYKVNQAQPFLTGSRGEVSGLNYQLIGTQSNLTAAQSLFYPGSDNQLTATANSGNLYYVWVEGQEKTKVEVRKFEKKSFNLFGDNAFGDLLVKDDSYVWKTVNFRDAVPVLESEVVYSPTLQGNGSANPSDPLAYIVGNAYTIKYTQSPDRDVTLVPGQTIVHLKDGFDPARGKAGFYYRIRSNVTTNLEVILPDENYLDNSRWEEFSSNPGSLQNTVESDFENYKQTVKRWTTGGGWLRKKTMHTEVTTISGVTDYYTHSLRADYPIQIDFVGSTASTSAVQINSVGAVVLQGDFDVPTGSSVTVNSSGGNVIGASTVGFYGATPALTVAGDININVETGHQPLVVTAGGNVVVDGITNSTNNGGSGDGPTGNVITVQQINANGDVFINAADGIVAQDANSYIHGDRIELRTLRGDIGSLALPIKIDSQYSGTGGLAAFAEGSIYIVETSGNLNLISPTSYSSQTIGETGMEGIAVRSLSGSAQLTTDNGDVVDGIKETFTAPTQAQIDALNDRMALFGAKAQEAADLTIRNEENRLTNAYHDYWLNTRNATRQNPATSTIQIASIDFTTNTIATVGNHGLQSGAEIHAKNGQIGLTNGFDYFVVVVDATHIRIAPTRFDAAIALPNDPNNSASGRIVDLVAGVDFNASQLSNVVLERFSYTSGADISGAIPGVLDAWRVGPYDPDFVYSMPQAEKDAILEARVRQATEVANPVSATLRRFLYPESYVFSSATTGQSAELRNISASEIRLSVNDTNPAVNPPTGRIGSLTGIQTLQLEYGINGANGQASLLTEAQKQVLASAIVDDVIGLKYVTYRFIGNSANPSTPVAYNFQDANHDFTDGSLWQRVEPDFITTDNQSPVNIANGQTVLVEYSKTSYGWYRYLGSPQTLTLSTQNFADTNLWQPITIDHQTADTQILEGEPLNTVKTVNLFNGQLVSDTTTVDRLTIEVVDDVNIEVNDEGVLIANADGDIALQANGELQLSQVQSLGNVRLSSSGDMFDMGFGNAAVTAVGATNLEGQVVQSVTVGSPLRVLVGPSGSLSGAAAGAFNVSQGHGTFTVLGQSVTFADLNVPRAFSGGMLSVDVTGGDLSIGKLESSTGFTLSASGSILDGDALSVQDEWNLVGPTALLSAGGTIGVSGNPIDLRVSSTLDADATGSVYLRSGKYSSHRLTDLNGSNRSKSTISRLLHLQSISSTMALGLARLQRRWRSTIAVTVDHLLAVAVS